MWPVEQAPTLITNNNNEDPIVVIGTSSDAAMTMQTDREIAQGFRSRKFDFDRGQPVNGVWHQRVRC